MPHEIDRVLAAFSGSVWAIDDAKGREIAAALALRADSGPRAEPFLDEGAPPPAQPSRQGGIEVLPLTGVLAPRASAVRDASTPFTSLTRWQARFEDAAADRQLRAIVLDIDTPGGMVDQVPETAAMIRAARDPDRPIIAVANTMAASAGYWIASAADQVVMSPSAMVGSIGVRLIHVDRSGAHRANGEVPTIIHAGARKAEGNDTAPLDDAARSALQAEVDDIYADFVRDVAASRGVAEVVVRADPEATNGAHMGGGRSYHARQALALNMADRVATLREVLSDLVSGGQGGARQAGGRARTRSASAAAAALRLA